MRLVVMCLIFGASAILAVPELSPLEISPQGGCRTAMASIPIDMYLMDMDGIWSSPEIVSEADFGLRPSVIVASSGNVIVSWIYGMNCIRYNEWDGSS